MDRKIVAGFRLRKEYGHRLHTHYKGDVRPVTALPPDVCWHRRGRNPVVELLPDRTDDVHACLRAHRAKRRRGQQPSEAVDLILAGPPPWEQQYDKEGNPSDDPPWEPEKVDAWAQAAVEFVKSLAGPESIIQQAWLHCDEKAPHIHVLFVPRRKGRISWKAVRTAFACAEKQRPNLDGPMHHALCYSTLRQSYYDRVGQPFGLARGKIGVYDDKKKRWGEAVDRGKSADARDRATVTAEKRIAEEQEKQAAEREKIEKEQRALAAEREEQEARGREQTAHLAREHARLAKQSEEAEALAEKVEQDTERLARLHQQSETASGMLEANSDAAKRMLKVRNDASDEARRLAYEKARVEEEKAGVEEQIRQLRLDQRDLERDIGIGHEMSREKSELGAKYRKVYKESLGAVKENQHWRKASGMPADFQASSHPFSYGIVLGAIAQVRRLARREAVNVFWHNLVQNASVMFVGARRESVIADLITVAGYVGDMWGANWPGKRDVVRKEEPAPEVEVKKPDPAKRKDAGLGR